MGPLRRHLRTATAPAHERLEAAFARHDLSRRSGYGAFLACHAAALAPLERALESSGIARLLPDWPQRSRRAALARDLARLGLRPPAPLPVALPAGPAATLGMAYVLEGSRLGAALLLPRALASADPAIRAATGFLRHGMDQRLWPAFLDLLETSPAARADPDRLAQGALAAFAAFESAALASPPQGAGHAATAS